MFGGKIFEDCGRLPQHEAILFKCRHASIGVFGKVLRRAGLAGAGIARDLVQRNIELGREQTHLPRVRGKMNVIKRDGHGADHTPDGCGGTMTREERWQPRQSKFSRES
jgi:hypothetical protein